MCTMMKLDDDDIVRQPSCLPLNYWKISLCKFMLSRYKIPPCLSAAAPRCLSECLSISEKIIRIRDNTQRVQHTMTIYLIRWTDGWWVELLAEKKVFFHSNFRAYNSHPWRHILISLSQALSPIDVINWDICRRSEEANGDKRTHETFQFIFPNMTRAISPLLPFFDKYKKETSLVYVMDELMFILHLRRTERGLWNAYLSVPGVGGEAAWLAVKGSDHFNPTFFLLFFFHTLTSNSRNDFHFIN